MRAQRRNVCYLLGQVLVLCPACQHSPQSLDRFGSGGSDWRVLVEVVGGGVTGGECSCGEAAPLPIVSVGFGQVVSFTLSGQNSRHTERQS